MELVFSKEKIAERICALAAELKPKFGDGENTVCVCVLRGAVMFFADLVRAMEMKCAELDFIVVTSYEGITTTGAPRLVKGTTCATAGKKVLIVEDIVDSGYTASFLREHFLRSGACDITLVSLLDKPCARKTDANPDYSAFTLECNDFVVGFGMDENQSYRALDGIYKLI